MSLQLTDQYLLLFTNICVSIYCCVLGIQNAKIELEIVSSKESFLRLVFIEVEDQSFFLCYFINIKIKSLPSYIMGRHRRDRGHVVVGFTTAYAIRVYHH